MSESELAHCLRRVAHEPHNWPEITRANYSQFHCDGSGLDPQAPRPDMERRVDLAVEIAQATFEDNPPNLEDLFLYLRRNVNAIVERKAKYRIMHDGREPNSLMVPREFEDIAWSVSFFGLQLITAIFDDDLDEGLPSVHTVAIPAGLRRRVVLEAQ